MNFDPNLIIATLLSCIATFIVGAVFGSVNKRVIRLVKIAREKIYRRRLLNYNIMADDLVELLSWSYKRRLDGSKMRIVFSKARNRQDLIPESEIKRYQKKYQEKNYTGKVCYLTHYAPDSQDHDADSQYIFKIKVAPSDYTEHLAVMDYLAGHPDKNEKIREMLLTNPDAYFANALPSSMSVNVVVVSEMDRILALRRSNAVAYGKNEWTIGIFETLLHDKMEAGRDATLYDLVKKGLSEEIGLTSENYHKDICISWMGVNMKNMGVFFIAVVKLKNITEAAVEQEMAKCHSHHEHTAKVWLPLKRRMIKRFLADKRKRNKYLKLIAAANGTKKRDVIISSLARNTLIETFRVNYFIDQDS